ncbi:MAG: response regulator [Fusobacteriota bacterium]
MSEKILIIDDEKNIRFMLDKSLSKDYDVTSAVNGEDGLEKLKEGEYDLILLDMKLPGMDGLEVLKKIKESNKEVTVIMITGFGNIDTAVEAMKLGAVDYLRKPFSSNEIRSIVSEVIERNNIDLSKESSEDYEDHLNHAKAYINKREFDKAEDSLNKAINLNSDKPVVFNLLGVILELQNKKEEAQKNYRAALALDPTYEPAKQNLSRTTKFDYSKENINMGEDK